MAILFAALSALFSAVNLLTQRLSSGAGPSGSAWRLMLYLLRQRLWLLGAAAAIGAFALQAVALHFGSLSVVQPVLVTELVFVLLLRAIWLRQAIRKAAWSSALVTCVALGVFLAAAEPRGGNPSATASAWAKSVALFGGLALVSALLARRGSPGRRAALYATSASILAALSATFLKELTNALSADGPSAAFTTWPLYAIIGSGITSALLTQAALHVGPLTISQPLFVVVDPIASIWLSVWLFGEYFTGNALVILIAAVAFAALIVGVVCLTRTAPHDDTNPSGGSPVELPQLDRRAS